MAGGYTTTTWENKDLKTTLYGKAVLGMKPNKLWARENIMLLAGECTPEPESQK